MESQIKGKEAIKLIVIYLDGVEIARDLYDAEKTIGLVAGADPEIFQRGGGEVEEENFERKMFVDKRINACTHKN